MADAVNGTSAPISQTESESLDDEAGPRLLPDPIAVVDKLHELRWFLECVYMATNDLEDCERDPLQFVIGHVSSGMRELAEEILPSEREA